MVESDFFQFFIKQLCDERQVLPYKLIRDATYPIRPWLYSPFKAEKYELPKHKTHWNFIKSSTRMSMERIFGMLKKMF
jgi:hypothetical protein